MILTKKPLSKALKTFYGVGDMGFSLMTSVEIFLFIFFLTTVAQFSLPMVAIIGSITSIVDALLSPFYGAIISGTKPLKWGRNRSWLLIAPPLVVVLFHVPVYQNWFFRIYFSSNRLCRIYFKSYHLEYLLGW
jgi:glycoside/pentoside/hexuronide:cation symporter, GPH family